METDLTRPTVETEVTRPTVETSLARPMVKVIILTLLTAMMETALTRQMREESTGDYNLQEEQSGSSHLTGMEEEQNSTERRAEGSSSQFKEEDISRGPQSPERQKAQVHSSGRRTSPEGYNLQRKEDRRVVILYLCYIQEACVAVVAVNGVSGLGRDRQHRATHAGGQYGQEGVDRRRGGWLHLATHVLTDWWCLRCHSRGSHGDTWDPGGPGSFTPGGRRTEIVCHVVVTGPCIK